ncbi:AI-2E family transporter [Halovenus sp. HT40]|uniref:AI-2E family transporter n=1 Tax=Halovenus sp. HT40 TaxID=3126691 RepID=UPI00300F2C9E
MMDDRDALRRSLIGAGVAGLFLLIAYVTVVFLAVLVFTIFLYYAVRPIFRFLDRFDLGRRVRAGLSIILFGLPFAALLGYTIAVIVSQLRELLLERGIIGQSFDGLAAELNVTELDQVSLEEMVRESVANLTSAAGQFLDVASLAGSIFVQALLIITGTYYLLVDGPRLAEWFFETYDDTGIVRSYVQAVDAELSVTLFGNIVNIFITATISLITFYSYNFFAPAGAAVPFPALLAALAGMASLIPVIGIKIIYIPLCLGLSTRAWLMGQLELLGPIAVLAVVSALFVDFVPDIIVRAQVSADKTHTGLLLVAYIVGPTVFGFYGLFLAPIVLVATTNAVTILLPYALSGERPDVQRTLEEYRDGSTPDDGDTCVDESTD